MKIKMFKVAAITLCSALTLSAGQAMAQEAKNLDELLDIFGDSGSGGSGGTDDPANSLFIPWVLWL